MCKARGKVKLLIAGRSDDYFLWTLASWMLELYDFLCEELSVTLEVEVEEEDVSMPRLYVDGDLVFEGVPGEEGYLVELLKHYFRSRRV